MGSIPNFNTDIYFRNNELFYELPTTTYPSIWGAYQGQGPAEMLSSGMLVPNFDTSSNEDLAPNHFSYGCSGYYEDVCDRTTKPDDYPNGGLVPRFSTTASTVCPLDHPQHNNWGYEVHDQAVPVMEEQSMKVGKYSAEEKKDRILRYLKKRTQRNFNKTIKLFQKYACRKTLADKRVRVRGRFARNNELLCEGGDKEVTMINHRSDNHHNEREFSEDDIIKIKYDEEEWLQEAMSSLMYFPYISG